MEEEGEGDAERIDEADDADWGTEPDIGPDDTPLKTPEGGTVHSTIVG